MRPLRKIALLLLLLALLPVVIFVTGRFQAMSENEALVRQIYDQQLETMLFSVNQHAWDVVDSWAGRLERDLNGVPATTQPLHPPLFSPAVRAVFLADTLLRTVTVLPTDAADADRWSDAASLGLTPEIARQLRQRQRTGFRQLEPLVLDSADATVAIVFSIESSPEPFLAGLILAAEPFIQRVLAPKLETLAQGRFALGVFSESGDAPIYATENLPRADVRRQGALWLFPGYEVGIRLSGATVEDLLQTRFYRDAVLLAVAALVLLAGGSLLYRNVRREVELARLKSDFVANVSHELRTPLALIRMYVETLELGRVPTEERRQSYYRIISQEAERLTHLINRILGFSKIEAGRKAYTLAPTDLAAVVLDVLDRYAPQFDEQGFTLETTLTEPLPPIQADADAIAEALINLLDNAVKYSGVGRHIGVVTGRDGETAFVEVEDQGIGIAPREQARIFEAFYRAEGSLVHTTKGTGLGLSLVRHIMEAHGGRVTVQSRPGAGSRFRLTFPLADPASITQPAVFTGTAP